MVVSPSLFVFLVKNGHLHCGQGFSSIGSKIASLHFGYPEHPQNLPPRHARSIISLPHCGQGNGNVLRSTYLHSGYPEHATKSPYLPFSCRNCLPHTGQFLSSNFGASCSLSSITPCSSRIKLEVKVHSGKPVHPKNSPLFPKRIANLCFPHCGHIISISTAFLPPSFPANSARSFSNVSWKLLNNVSRSSSPSAILSSSSSICAVNLGSIISGKFFTSISVTNIPSSVGTNFFFSRLVYARARIVLRTATYVLGRPIPSFSNSLTSEASVNRAGGCVKCCLGSTFFKSTLFFAFISAGSCTLSSFSPSSSS